MIGLKLDRYDSGGASHPTCPPKHWRRRKLRNLGSIVAVGSEGWWRRGGANPRPKTLYSGLLRAVPGVSFSSPGTPAGRVPFGPSRFGFRPSSPREGDWGYPVRATPFRLHGQSAVGRTRLVRPRRRSYSRWRLLVPAFNEVRGASARNPGASTSPSKPFRPRRFKIPCFPGQGEPPSETPNRPALHQNSGPWRIRPPSDTGPTSRDIGRTWSAGSRTASGDPRGPRRIRPPRTIGTSRRGHT